MVAFGLKNAIDFPVRASTTIHPSVRHVGAALVALCISCLVSCQPKPSYTLVNHSYDKPRLREKTFTTSDRQTFPYRKFIAENPDASEPETVVIALHGFCGSSIDYENLGQWLVKEKPTVALYAYDIRGQGMDPIYERRGDIDAPQNWFRDLTTFTALIKKRHPGASIVWQGESMGALILANAYRYEMEQGRRPACDAIVMTSPVVGLRGDFPVWKKETVRVIAKLLPAARISLDTLAEGESLQMTASSTHSQQSETNAWHIERHTLRLLLNLSDLMDQMKTSATTFRVPTLVVHGGKDYLTESHDVISFYEQLAQTPAKKRLFYPDGHHLLMYDEQKDLVISDIGEWLARLPELTKTAKAKTRQR